MIAGGIKTSGSFTDSVVEYDIDANTYNTIQSLPNPIRRSTLVNSNGSQIRHRCLVPTFMYLHSNSTQILALKKTVFFTFSD